MEDNMETTTEFEGFGMGCKLGFAAGVITTAGTIAATWIAKKTAESLFNRIAGK